MVPCGGCSGGLLEQRVTDWEKGFCVRIAVGIIDVLLRSGQRRLDTNVAGENTDLYEMIKNLLKVFELAIVKGIDAQSAGKLPLCGPEGLH